MSDTRRRADVVIEPGLRAAHRALAAQGYWRAFSRKLRYPLGPEAKAAAFLDRALDPRYAISACKPDGAFLGAAGFKTPDGAFIGGRFSDLVAVYGWAGAVFRGALIGLLERGCAPGVLLMDGLFVVPEARGLGVGTALLTAIERRAAADGLDRVRLDVIDANPRARALYERQGYRAGACVSLGPLGPIFGFSTATEMVKTVRA